MRAGSSKLLFETDMEEVGSRRMSRGLSVSGAFQEEAVAYATVQRFVRGMWELGRSVMRLERRRGDKT